MNKTKELIEIINKHPEHELIFMYPDEGSDHSYTMGYLTRVLVDEYWIDSERVWLRYDNEDEIIDHYGDNIADDLFTKFPLTDEENKIVDDKLEEFIKDIKWEKCICVYIHY